MKFFLPAIALLFSVCTVHAQQETSDFSTEAFETSVNIFLENESFDSASFYNQKLLKKYLQTEKWKNYVVALNRQITIFIGLQNLDQAKQSAELAVKHANQYLGDLSIELADAYAQFGDVYFYENDNEKALEYQNKAIGIYQQLQSEDSLNIGHAYFTIGKIHKRSQNLEKAIEFVKKAASVWTAAEKDHRVIDSYDLLGSVHLIKGDHFIAIDYYEKALEMRHEVFPDTSSTTYGISYSQLGQAYAQIGEIEQGVFHHEKALRIYVNNLPKDDPSLAEMYGNLSHGYTQNGQYNKALDYALKDLEITTKAYGDKHPDLITIYDNIGLAYRYKEEFEKAQHYHTKAVDFGLNHLSENHPGLGASYLNLGVAQNALGKRKTAFENYEKALNIYSVNYGETHWILAIIYSYMGNFYLEAGEFEAAKKYYIKALVVEESNFGKKNAFKASTYGFIGQSFKGLKDYKQALSYFQNSFIANVLDFEDSLISSNPNYENAINKGYLLTSLIEKAESLILLYKETGNLTYLIQAQDTYDKCSELIEVRIKSRNRSLDKSELGGRANRIYTGAIVANHLNYAHDPKDTLLEKMFHYMEKNKASILTLNLRDSKAKDFGNIPISLLEAEQMLLSKQSYFKSNILKARQSNDSTQLIKNGELLTEINLKIDSLVIALETKYPAYHQLKYQNETISTVEVQNKMSPNQVLIEYVENDSILYISAISKNKFWVESFSKDSTFVAAENLFVTSLNPEMLKLDFSIHYSQFTKSAHHLYQKLLQPILEKVSADVNHLILIPTDELSHIPWDLFIQNAPNEGQDYKNLNYVLNNYSVSYAHSATLLLQDGGNPASNKDISVLAFAPSYSGSQGEQYRNLAPVFRNEMGPLEWTEYEINEINKLFPGKYLSGEQATEANFKKTANSHGILHLAMHAFVDDENPMQSKLVFYQDNDSIEDGMLHTYELFNMNIPAQMAVLSACETGLGKIQKSEGVMSLGRAFSYAGCPSIVTSHWSVDDQSTSELMTFFYKYIADGMSKDKALQQAKLDFLSSTNGPKTHPYYWGGFVVLGDTKPLSGKTNYTFIILAVIMVIIPVGVWWSMRDAKAA
ncbi:CHAT domain-containing protein [Ekhidna sp.]|uniref:CHAT domain-containing protein n=1 Tax=Ekhidna sp. TaxID=2608089 RepID=UPI003BAA1D2F